MSAGPAPLALPRFRRVEHGRAGAGVCAGIADGMGVDATLVRLAFALLVFAAGAGIVAYLGLWALLPAPGAAATTRGRRVLAVLLLIAAVQLALHGLGLASSFVWPLALGALGYLAWTRGAAVGLTEHRRRLVAVVCAIAAGASFVSANARGTATVLLAPAAVALALLLVLVPWAWRLVRERDAEREARVRSQERAEMAARVHDSVLQTLALIQREPQDPRRVATLARRQERELRAWLYPGREATPEGTLADALEAAAAEIEELHGVRVEVVRTGDAPLGERVEALVLAAREAMTNAARHSGADEVSVFLDAGGEGISLYVRDRGVGFDPGGVADDRRGLTESIRGRMERVGGSAHVVSTPGEGTEVEIVLPERP